MADEFSYSAKDLYGDYGYGEEGVTFSALDAIIRNLKVSSAQIENAAITDAHIKDVSIDKLVAGSMQIDSNNLLFNATWGGNTLGWDISGTRDTVTRFKGYNSIKVEQTGNTSDVYRGVWQNKTYANRSQVGEVWTASVYVMTNDWYTFDGPIGLEIEFLDSAGNRAGIRSMTWFPDVNNTWTRLSVTGTAPTNTAKINVIMWVRRNGRAWFACPMIQRGSFLTEFTPNGTYIGPDGIMTSDITFTGKLSGASGTFSGDLKIDHGDGRYIHITKENFVSLRGSGYDWSFLEPNRLWIQGSDIQSIMHKRGIEYYDYSGPSGTIVKKGEIYFSGTAISISRLAVVGDTNVKELHADGWLRTYGDRGWYSQTYGGGWYMTDTTWLRAYGGKNIYTPGIIESGSGYHFLGRKVSHSWYGTINSSNYADITHNLGYYPIITTGGNVGNLQITHSFLDVNRVRIYNYSSGGNAWTGSVHLY